MSQNSRLSRREGTENLIQRLATARRPIGHPEGAKGLNPTQRTTQNPASAPPRTCRIAPADLLRADYMARTGLGRRSMGATLD
eukprot:COSAG01_NODE_57781_length_310_cov_0.729858_1_plen_82_part_10